MFRCYSYTIIRERINLCLLKLQNNCNFKAKISPVTGVEWPRGFQEVKVPGFHDNGTGWW